MTSQAPGGVVVANTFDAMGRLTGASGSGAEVATTARAFGYDKAGRLTSAAAGTANQTFTYDERDSMLTANGTSGDSAFTYADDGQLASRVDAAGLTKYRYDTAGRLSAVDDPATGTTLSVGYRSMNLVDSISYGTGGNKRSLSYDTLHRLKSDTMKTAAGATVASISYGYDDNDNLTSKTTTGFAGAATNTYTYDLANRLTSWNDGSKTTNYGYDPSGNRTTAGSRVFTYDARNQLIGDGETTYRYTARGTQSQVVTSSGSVPVAFDAFGQVASHGALGYSYDALGRVVSASKSGQTTTFSYSGAGNTIANDGTSTYTRLPDDGLLAVGSAVSGAQPALLAWTDQHDDVVGEFTATGSALSRSVAYDPWGELATAKSLTGGLGFQSGWTDPDSGRVDMWSRWYEPGDARFVSRDAVAVSPMPASVSANQFAYVNDNPLAGTDPTGECSWWDVACRARSVAHSVSHAVSKARHAVSHVVHRAKRVVHRAYHTARKVVRHVVHHAKRVVHRVVHRVRDGYHRVRHWVSHTWHRVKHAASRVYHKAKHVVKRVVRHISSATHKAARGIKHAAERAKHAVSKAARGVSKAASRAGAKAKQAKAAVAGAVKKAASATARFVSKHAATIVSVVVSTAVFAGCEALITVVTGGAGALPGAIVCGALAGSVGEWAGAAWKAHHEGRSLSMEEASEAASRGLLFGALGGAAGPLAGKAVAAVGGRLAGPVAAAVGRASGGVERSAARGGGLRPGNSVARAEAKPGGHCSFAGSTSVLLADGSRRPIARVRVGDRVVATDPRTGSRSARAVTHVWVHRDRLVDLVVGGRVVTTTRNHPFWSVTDQRFERADELGVGELVEGDHARRVPVAGMVWGSGRWGAAYNLSVAGVHTYHVGRDDILVHNTGDELRGRSCSIGGAADLLPTPGVENVKLQNIVNNLYKGTTNPNRVGNGTTMDAIRSEVATGAPTGGRMHVTKGQESLRGLNNWLAKNRDARYSDRLVAESLADELRSVLPR